jgi:nucleotide-binding universal stress UspA family protein
MAKLQMLAAVNLSSGDDQAARRAATLARAMGWDLTLIATVHHPEYAQDLFHISGALEKVRRDLEDDYSSRLESLAAELEFDQARVDAFWAYPFDQGLMAAIERHAPQIAVISLGDSHQPSKSEWRAIQSCPVPMLIVRSGTWKEHPVVMACVDPSHAHARSDILDGDIMSWAHRITVALGTRLDVLHAAGMVPNLKGDDPYPDQYRTRIEKERLQQIRDLAPTMDEDLLVCHFSHTSAVEAIDAFTKAREVDLCVLGSISRSWLQDKLIGGTLRELIPRTDCDLMLIPPLMG